MEPMSGKVTLNEVTSFFDERATEFVQYASFSTTGFYKRLEFALDGRSRVVFSRGTGKPVTMTYSNWTSGIEAYNMQTERTREEHQLAISEWIGEPTHMSAEDRADLESALYACSELGIFGDMSIDSNLARLVAKVVHRTITKGFPKDLRV